MPPVKASDINFKGLPRETDRVFRIRGEQQYSFEINPLGVIFEVDRLRRSSQELWGELVVRVNGHFHEAKTVQNGILSWGDLNFSSVNARASRAKLLSERARTDGVDWHGFVEELAIQIVAHERNGRPAVVLAEVNEASETTEAWDVLGFPILRELPQVLFGDSATGKSYFAMYVVGELARDGVNVLYADWEFTPAEHRKRFARLFAPMPRNVFYTRCDRPLAADIDRIARLVREHRCQYVVCDSIGFAVDGRDSGFEGATDYFRALRQLGVGSLNIAHIPKSTEQGKDAQIFGSAFFRHGARSIWYVERAQNSPKGRIQIGLYHRKSNVGEHLPPRAYAVVFEHERTRVERLNLDSVEELTVALPLFDRMKAALADGPLSIKVLAQMLDIQPGGIRSTVSRYKSHFVRDGERVALKPQGEDF